MLIVIGIAILAIGVVLLIALEPKQEDRWHDR